MSKEEFLSQLDRKLQIINERERKDIIDEYRSHLEMKIRDGKSEEEATADFGDIDELVDEILDAYKINTNQVHNKDDKLDSFLDDLFKKCKNIISSITSLDTDDVVKLLFEFFVVLLLLWIIRIPFEIVSSLGSSLLDDMIGLGVGHFLSKVWELIFDLIYAVLFIVLLIKVFDKRVRKYRNSEVNKDSIIDDFKESFTSTTNKETYTTSEPYSDVNQEEPKVKEYHNVGSQFMDVAHVIMRIVCVILMIPMIGIVAGLACVLGIMVVMSIQGFTLAGLYVCVSGLICIMGAFIGLAYDVLWKRGKAL